MFYKFIMISFAIHASALGHFAMTKLEDRSLNFDQVDVEILSQVKPNQLTSATLTQQPLIVTQTKSPQPSFVEKSTEAREDLGLAKMISLDSGVPHPYLNSLWKNLLRKKKSASLIAKEKQTYLVRLKITKVGFIESVDVKGVDQQVAHSLESSLLTNPRVPPVPDDISNQDFYVQYAVTF